MVHKAKKNTNAESPKKDDLLPLLGRGVFDQDVAAFVEEAERSRDPLSLLLLDLDSFKSINDMHGHQVGDDALVGCSMIIDKRVGAKGRVYRYGGEEIVVLLPNYSVPEAAALAESIRKIVEESPVSKKCLRVTVSVGVACFPNHADSAKDLMPPQQNLWVDSGWGRLPSE